MTATTKNPLKLTVFDENGHFWPIFNTLKIGCDQFFTTFCDETLICVEKRNLYFS